MAWDLEKLELASVAHESVSDVAAAVGRTPQSLLRYLSEHPPVEALVRRARKRQGLAAFEIPTVTRLDAGDEVLMDRLIAAVARGPTLSTAAENLGCGQAALTKFIQRNPQIKAAIANERAAQDGLRGHNVSKE